MLTNQLHPGQQRHAKYSLGFWCACMVTTNYNHLTNKDLDRLATRMIKDDERY